MATAYRTSFVTLGGLNCGTMAIDAFDWSTLLASAPKRGSNRVLPGLTGREPRPRVVDELRALLQFRLRGDMTDENAVVPGGEAAWSDMIYTRLDTLRTVCNNTGLQTITLRKPNGTTLSSQCFVEEMTAPQFVLPWIATLVVDLTVPTGPLGT